MKTDVVIIGAGPTGLSLACHLVRYGVDFIIIEQKESVTPYSKAIGVHARTLEIYEQIGLANFEQDEGEVLYEEIERRIKEEAEFELDVTRVEWFSIYKVHSRHVNEFSSGRCFLAGDAARVHTPAGGQGMNTGIQDGYNLAWKLALVVQGKADKKLLETYNEERLENAKHLLQTTDRIFQFAAGSGWFLAFLRTDVLPPIAKYILDVDWVKSFVFPLLSQIGINYRHGSLSLHAGDENFKVKAGDRMPYFLVDGASIYNKLREPRFHLLVFSDAHDDFQALKTKLENEYAESVDFNLISLDSQAAEIFGANKSFSLLLRPDNYIGFISQETSLGELRSYLNKFVGYS
ncbi:MAG: FAD-dependent monooxygenase [Pyrinomonadaceae bacterium]